MGEVAGSGLIFKDTLKVEAFDDPKVAGVQHGGRVRLTWPPVPPVREDHTERFASHLAGST